MSNRPIKFRAQDIASNKWLFGDIRHHKNDVCIFEQGGNIGEQVKPDTIGQFTGFDNCFGSEIYEGDILLYCNDNSKHVVAYHNGSFGINVGEQFIPLSQLYLGIDSCYRVIGNIHDHPSLIEKGGSQ